MKLSKKVSPIISLNIFKFESGVLGVGLWGAVLPGRVLHQGDSVLKNLFCHFDFFKINFLLQN